MDKRRAEIESGHDEVEKKQAEADELAHSLRQKEQELEDGRTELLRQAEADAERRHQELTDQARAEVDRQRSRWEEELGREQDAFLERLTRRGGEQVCAVVRRTLVDLSDTELERRMVETLISRVGDLDEEGRRQLAQAVQEADGVLTVSSAFEMSDDLRRMLTDALHHGVAPEAEVRFETSPDLVCGVAVTAAGRELSWTVAGYLQSLADRIQETFAEEQRRTESTTEQGTEPETEAADV
jgi:alternate F1F0 ATPase F0 subunit B